VKKLKITKIRLRRINAGLMDTKQAVQALGISTSAFYKIEQGYLVPSAELLKRMANTYKCSVDEIFKDLGITG
jgi:transcriptional regulator with XRE-family HTH domain